MKTDFIAQISLSVVFLTPVTGRAVSKADAAKIMHGTKVPCKTWTEYCEEIGSSKQMDL